MKEVTCEAVTAFHMIMANGGQPVLVQKGALATMLDWETVQKASRHVMLVGDIAWRELPVGLLFRKLPGQEDDTKPQLFGDELFMFRTKSTSGTNNWTSCTRQTYEELQKLSHVETMIVRPVKNG